MIGGDLVGGGFLKSTQPKKTFGCADFLSHKKMAVEKMKSHFGCGICPDRSKHKNASYLIILNVKRAIFLNQKAFRESGKF